MGICAVTSVLESSSTVGAGIEFVHPIATSAGADDQSVCVGGAAGKGLGVAAGSGMEAEAGDCTEFGGMGGGGTLSEAGADFSPNNSNGSSSSMFSAEFRGTSSDNGDDDDRM